MCKTFYNKTVSDLFETHYLELSTDPTLKTVHRKHFIFGT